jgi:hypothetical protein
MIAKSIAVFSWVILPLSVLLWHQSHKNPYQNRYDVTLYKSLRVYLREGVCGLRLLSMPTKVASRSGFNTSLHYDALPGGRSLLLSREQVGPYYITWFAFPLWLSTCVLLTMGTVPLAYGPARQVWRRWKGCCAVCGYNLTGNRSGRCSECGTRFR